ncbi:hypothetical protein IAU59_003345 [Kwoniella sp. CBS 9459]
MSLPYTYTPLSPYPNYAYPLSETMNTPSPIYTLLITGMVFFMAANVMPNLIPAADRVWHVAPMVLQWGFIIIIFALMVQMTGLIPGVPQIHITYVHMAIATLLFILMWNHIVSQTPPTEEYKSSSSSSAKKEEKKPGKKREEPAKNEKPPEPSPWDDLRAHPSAFLTTRLNKLMPWPFPMGKAGRGNGPELWWEKGMPSHVGHFNRPDPDAAKKAAEAEKEAAKKKKAKEEAEKKAKEKEKAEKEKAAKLKEKEKAEAEAKARARAKEEEARRAKEEAKRREEEKRLRAIEDRHKLKMWRTKYLAMIIGISMLNKTLGFLLLLLFSLQLVSQELNEKPTAAAAASASVPAPSTSSASKPSSGSSSSTSSAEKEKAGRAAAAAKEREQEKEKEKAKSSFSSSSKSSSTSSSSSSSTDKEKDKEKSKEVVGSEAIKKAAGSKTVTNVDPDEGFGVPYRVGFGMHYIHSPNPDKPGDLTLPSLFIPSEGMSHPLMTTTYRQFAN